MKKRVLLVDDAKFMRMILKEILKEAGCEVVGEASDGEQAVKAYRELNPDLVTMDIIMPGMSGVDVVKRIIEFDKDARILMVSAMGQQELVAESLEAGARDFIVKPFVPDEVLGKIQKILAVSSGKPEK